MDNFGKCMKFDILHFPAFQSLILGLKIYGIYCSKNLTCFCGWVVFKIHSSTLILTCLWTSKQVLTKALLPTMHAPAMHLPHHAPPCHACPLSDMPPAMLTSCHAHPLPCMAPCGQNNLSTTTVGDGEKSWLQISFVKKRFYEPKPCFPSKHWFGTKWASTMYFCRYEMEKQTF